MHWGYGTQWGGVRGFIEAAGLRGPAATVAHFGAVWVTGLLMQRVLEVAPPVGEWDAREFGIDGLHHAVYAAASGAVYSLLVR